MSWTAYLVDDRGHTEGEWDYTHNTNGMIAAAYKAVTGQTIEQCDGPLGRAIGAAWWYGLHDKSGPEGAEYLNAIIKGLEAEPSTYQAMNPENGWGSYDGGRDGDEGILNVLRKMRDAVPEWPTKWDVHG